MKKLISFLIGIILLLNILEAQEHPFAGGNGTESNPYKIATAGQFDSIRYYFDSRNNHFEVIRNINLGEYIDTVYTLNGWENIGDWSTPFDGKLNGGGHDIIGFKFSRENAEGALFHSISTEGIIENLRLLDVDILYSGEWGGRVAVITLKNEGIVSKCYVSGTASARRLNISGMVGENRGTIRFCQNNCDIMGGIGGIAGSNSGNIYCCYNTGHIKANSNPDIGGIVSSHAGCGHIYGCYNVGIVEGGRWSGNIVGSINAYAALIDWCYYDKDVNPGLPGLGGGVTNPDPNEQGARIVGKTTAEMKQKNTFEGEWWSFDNIWQIEEGKNYPILRDNPKNIEYDIRIEGPKEVCTEEIVRYTTYKLALASSYQWEISGGGTIVSGTNSNYIDVIWKNEGKQWLKLSIEAGGECDHTLEVNVGTDLNLFIEEDLCEELLLSTGKPSNYKCVWSTGDTTHQIKVNKTGYYWAEVEHGGCVARDTIFAEIKPLRVTIKQQGVPCEGEDLFLEADINASKFLWNTGETTKQIKVTASGQYWVEAEKNGCIARDTLNVTISPKPQVYIIMAERLCDAELLAVTNSWFQFLWNTGETTQLIVVDEAGEYWVKVTDNQCSNTATFNYAPVNAVPKPQINREGPLCENKTTELSVSTTISDILWSTGETSAQIEISQPGDYWVEVGNGICTNSDTIKVEYAVNPTLQLTKEGDVCEGGNTYITATTDAQSIAWSTGVITEQIRVTSTGLYWAEVEKDGCITRDTIGIQLLPAPELQIIQGGDLCRTGNVTLTAQTDGESLVWNTAEITSQIIVDKPGTYSVTATSKENCKTQKNIHVEKKIPQLSIEQAGDFCQNGIQYLTAQTNAEQVLWNTGETSVAITINQPGEYKVTASTGICQTSQSIEIACSCEIEFPNAFDPGSVMNSTFGPAENRRIISFQMYIFDRWGKRLFETTSIENRWDGKVDGKLVPQGGYVYIARYLCEGDTVFKEKQGTVLLMR